MRFAVVRVSQGFRFKEDDPPPCIGARKEPRVNVEEAQPLDGVMYERWYEEGHGHKESLNVQTRRKEFTRYVDVWRWVIEISTLDELIAFADNVGGRVIIDEEYGCLSPMRQVIIYDDYIE